MSFPINQKNRYNLSMEPLTKDQFFIPTSAMKVYALVRAKSPAGTTDKVLAAKAGLAPETISRWKGLEGFEQWLADEMSNLGLPIILRLEQIALERADKDFRFWQILAEKYQYKVDRWCRNPEEEIEKY